MKAQNTPWLSFYKKGGGKPSVIILTAMGSIGAEWRHIVDRLSNKYETLVYDRPGYGQSGDPHKPRTPANAAEELRSVIQTSGVSTPVILAGHSLGGLYAQEFAMRYPGLTAGLVLLDPMTVENNGFKSVLTEEEYRRSPIDKSPGIRLGKTLCALGLGFLVRALSHQAIPFYYYNHFGKEAKKAILDSKASKRTYAVCLDEYIESEKEENILELKNRIFSGNKTGIPATLVLHDPEFMIGETMEFGGSSRETAEKIEAAWSSYMKNTLPPFAPSKTFIAKNGGHYMALTHPGLLEEAVAFVAGARA